MRIGPQPVDLARSRKSEFRIFRVAAQITRREDGQPNKPRIRNVAITGQAERDSRATWRVARSIRKVAARPSTSPQWPGLLVPTIRPGIPLLRRGLLLSG